MTITTSAPTRSHFDAGDDRTTWTKIAGACGIVAALLWFGMGAAIAADSPGLGDSAEEIRTWMQDNQGAVSTFTLGMALTVMLLLVFAAGLRNRLEAVDRTGFLPSVFFGAVVANTAGGLIGLSLWAVLGHDIGAELSDDVVLALSALDTMVFFAVLPWAAATALIAASTVIIQTRVMPAWLGGLGLVFGIAGAVGTLWLPSGDAESFLAMGPGFIGFAGSLLWFALVGGHMVRNPID